MGSNAQKITEEIVSEPTISKVSTDKKLAKILQQAGLVSATQIEIAYKIQKQQPNLTLGEIFSLQEWIEPATADFFVQQWSNLVAHPHQKPIGYYLKQAGLLTERQIEILLATQQQTQLKFGELAVQKKWIGQAAIDFFLQHLSPRQSAPPETEELESNCLEINRNQDFKQICDQYLQLEPEDESYHRLLREIFTWTRGQPWLTQKLCQVIAQSSLIPGKETKLVSDLVRSEFLDNWEIKAAAEHLGQIQDRLLDNQDCQPLKLLELYQTIRQQYSIPLDYSREQTELLLLGLVRRDSNSLMVANPIYLSVFNRSWVAQKLAELMRQSIAETSNLAQTELTLAIEQLKQQETRAKSAFNIGKMLPVAIILAGLSLILLKLAGRHYQFKSSFQAGNQLLNEQQYQRAIAKYDRLLQKDSNYYQAWTNRGYALAKLGQYNKMLESCSTATIIEPEAVYAWNCQGEALHNLERYPEAVVAFNRAIALDNTDPVFWINKSESLGAGQQYARSLAAINQAIAALEKQEAVVGKEQVQGEFAIALNYKARALSQQQKYDQAIAVFQRALTYQGDYFPAQIGKAIARYELQQYATAREELEQILSNPQLSKPQKATTWFYLGRTLCQFSRPQESAIAFKSALELKPDYEAAKLAQTKCSNN